MENSGNGHTGRGGVTLRGLTVGYRDRIAVEALSGVFAAGSLTAIVGPNGAGKTTLLQAIAGLVRPRVGSIELATAVVPADLAYLPQSTFGYRPRLPDLGSGIRGPRWLANGRRARTRAARVRSRGLDALGRSAWASRPTA